MHDEPRGAMADRQRPWATEGQMQFRRLLETLPAAAYTCDPQGLITYFNPHAAQLWGRSPALNDPVDRFCGSFRLYAADGTPIAHAECWMARALATGREFNAEEIIIERPDGTRRTVLAHANPTFDVDGRLIGAVNVLVDITERKRAEVAQMMLAAIVESSEDAIVSKTLEGRILTWNAGAERLFGYTAQEAIGQPITMIIPPERQAEEETILSRLRRGERIAHFETVRVAKDGRRVDISLTISPVRDGSGRIVGASKVARDITAHKQAAQALRESEERFSKFMQHIPGLAWIKDLEGRYAFVNDAAERAFGKSRAELYGKTDEEIFPPETAAMFRENDRKALSGEAGVETIETLEHADGLHYSVVSKFPIPGPDGVPLLIGGMAIDITERIRAENELREADRRKDVFLATLAHELRNPLAPISNSLHILRLSEDLSPALERVRAIMERQVGLLVRLVDDLLEVSRITRDKIELRKERVDLVSIITSALETSRPLIDEADHQLAITISPEPMTLEADPVRLAQVLANLLNNAAKYTEPGGQIWLTARREGRQAVISVRDTGLGIPAARLPHVFDMFAQVEDTRRRSQGGLGIGLTISRRLVQMHGGQIEARSEGPGKGSEFVVRLPLMTGAVIDVVTPPPAGDSRAPVPRRRILVVDDAPAAIDTLGRLLEALGNEVRTAADATEALAAARAMRPDLVISDIGMPGMDGYELAARLRRLPELEGTVLVALTGYGQHADRKRARDAGFDEHLVKPVGLETLQALLASLPAPRAAATPGASIAP